MIMLKDIAGGFPKVLTMPGVLAKGRYTLDGVHRSGTRTAGLWMIEASQKPGSESKKRQPGPMQVLPIGKLVISHESNNMNKHTNASWKSVCCQGCGTSGKYEFGSGQLVFSF